MCCCMAVTLEEVWDQTPWVSSSPGGRAGAQPLSPGPCLGCAVGIHVTQPALCDPCLPDLPSDIPWIVILGNSGPALLSLVRAAGPYSTSGLCSTLCKVCKCQCACESVRKWHRNTADSFTLYLHCTNLSHWEELW